MAHTNLMPYSISDNYIITMRQILFQMLGQKENNAPEEEYSVAIKGDLSDDVTFGVKITSGKQYKGQ